MYIFILHWDCCGSGVDQCGLATHIDNIVVGVRCAHDFALIFVKFSMYECYSVEIYSFFVEFTFVATSQKLLRSNNPYIYYSVYLCIAVYVVVDVIVIGSISFHFVSYFAIHMLYSLAIAQRYQKPKVIRSNRHKNWHWTFATRILFEISSSHTYNRVSA